MAIALLVGALAALGHDLLRGRSRADGVASVVTTARPAAVVGAESAEVGRSTSPAGPCAGGYTVYVQRPGELPCALTGLADTATGLPLTADYDLYAVAPKLHRAGSGLMLSAKSVIGKGFHEDLGKYTCPESEVVSPTGRVFGVTDQNTLEEVAAEIQILDLHTNPKYDPLVRRAVERTDKE